MRITRIDLDGFGCMRGFGCDLGRGLHIFFGPNESGKSTLQHAIFALLYGFYEGSRARPHETRQHDRYRPWSGSAYGGRLEFEVETGADKGKSYRVDRDFGDRDVPTTVRDLTTGQDVTDRYARGRHGAVAFAREYLGMTKKVFDACAFVSQGELFDLANETASPQEIGDTIISLADSARRDVSAQSAIDRLDAVLKEDVGGPRARTTPLPVARGHLAEAEGELAEIERMRVEVAEDAERLEDNIEKANEARATRTRGRYLILQAELADRRTRLQQLDELDEEGERLNRQMAEHAEFAQFPVEERDDLLGRWNTISNLRESQERTRERASTALGRLESITSELRGLQRRVQELDHLRDYPLDRGEAVELAVASWRSVKLLAEEAARRREEARVPEELLEELDSLEAKVGELTPDDIEDMRRRLTAPPPNWFTLRAITHAVITALQWLWRGTIRLVRWVFRRGQPGTGEPAESEARALAQGREELAEKVREYERYLELAPRVRRLREAAREAASREEELAGAAQNAHGELENLVDDVSDIEQAYRTSLDRRAQRRELEGLEAKIAALLREADTLRGLGEEYDQEGSRLARLEDALRRDLERWTGKEGSLHELLAGFEDGCRRRELHDEARAGLAANAEKRSLILKGRSRSELEEDVRLREREAAGLEEQTPRLRGAQTDDSLETLSVRFRELDDCANMLEVEIERLRTLIETKLSDLNPRSEVEEEIERLEKKVAALDRFGQELTIAIEVIDQAMTEAHRNFAPSVGRFLSSGFNRITGGRYTEVLLDPATLKLTTEIPETGDFQEVELLSRGTRATVYLLLRAGLAQHMSGLSEPVPLILDDPLVELDDVRLESFLDELLRLSDEIQILLFTKDQGTKTWFERHHFMDPRHRLTVLAGPRPLASASGSE